MSTTMTVNEPAAASADERAGKYLTFQLSNEEFGIRVLKVREIMGLQEITAVPQTPAHIKGVINLRGKVVPVIDLRLKFGLAAAEYTQRTCIIVTQVQGESGAVLMGIVVDGVSEVLNLTGSEIEDTPDFGEEYSGRLSARYGQGEGQGQDPAGYRSGAVHTGPAQFECDAALTPHREELT